MKVWVVVDSSNECELVWDVFDSLEKADDAIMDFYYRHSYWLHAYEQDVH